MEGRWWEYYVVRYFVGTVVGAAIIVFLNGQENVIYSGLLTKLVNFKEAEFLGVSLVAAVGFSYCYIASAPILSLHATRAHLRISVVKSCPAITIPVILAAIGISIFIAYRSFSCAGATIIGTVIGIQFGLLAAVFLNQGKELDSFYWDLAGNRAKAAGENGDKVSTGTEYVTSYRHLREHGNAFGIVVLEIVFAYGLLQLNTIKDAALFILVWMLPAAACWIVGTFLEARFAEKYLP